MDVMEFIRPRLKQMIPSKTARNALLTGLKNGSYHWEDIDLAVLLAHENKRYSARVQDMLSAISLGIITDTGVIDMICDYARFQVYKKYSEEYWECKEIFNLPLSIPRPEYGSDCPFVKVVGHNTGHLGELIGYCYPIAGFISTATPETSWSDDCMPVCAIDRTLHVEDWYVHFTRIEILEDMPEISDNMCILQSSEHRQLLYKLIIYLHDAAKGNVAYELSTIPYIVTRNYTRNAIIHILETRLYKKKEKHYEREFWK